MIDYEELKLKAIELKKSGMNYTEISKELKLSLNQIRNWIYYNKKPHQPKNLPLKESAYKLSEELAYILGVIEGDGSISKVCNNICLSCKDRDFIEEFKRNLEEWSGIKTSVIYKIDYSKKNRNDLFSVVLCSKEAKLVLNNFNFDSLLNSTEKIKSNFLRGIYDSEGSVIKANLNIKRKDYTRKVVFYNTNKETILFVARLLKDLGIDCSIYNPKLSENRFGNKPVYRIVFSNRKNIERYYKKVGFSIMRKQEKLKDIVNSYVSKYYELKNIKRTNILEVEPLKCH